MPAAYPLTGLRSVGLLLTYDCNLRCTYCYVRNHARGVMPLSVAQTAISDLLYQEGELAEILLMGGEPFCAFDRLREIVEWTQSMRWARPFRFFAATNGTLLTPAQKAWIVERKDIFLLGLSFDGLEAAQDANRSASSGRIDMAFFHETWPLQTVKMTVSPHTVGQMAQGVIYLTEKGFPVIANASYEPAPWPEAAILEYGRQLSLLVEYYYRHPRAPRISQMSQPLQQIASGKHGQQPQHCSAGTSFAVIDGDGARYACHILSPLVLSPEQLADPEIYVHAASRFADERCDGCLYTHICPTCLGCNYVYQGALWRRDAAHCRIFQYEMLACMKLQTRLLLDKATLSVDESRTAFAIREIMRRLPDNPRIP